MSDFEKLHEAIEDDVFKPADEEEITARDEDWKERNARQAAMEGDLDAIADEIADLIQNSTVDDVKKFLMSPIVKHFHKEDVADAMGEVITTNQAAWTVKQLLQLQWMLDAGSIPIGGYREDV